MRCQISVGGVSHTRMLSSARKKTILQLWMHLFVSELMFPKAGLEMAYFFTHRKIGDSCLDIPI